MGLSLQFDTARYSARLNYCLTAKVLSQTNALAYFDENQRIKFFYVTDTCCQYLKTFFLRKLQVIFSGVPSRTDQSGIARKREHCNRLERPARYKHSSLFGPFIKHEKNIFYITDTQANIINFLGRILLIFVICNKLEYQSLVSLSILVKCLK